MYAYVCLIALAGHFPSIVREIPISLLITEHPLPCPGCASVAELLFTNCKVRVQERDYSDHLALNFLCNNCKHFAGKTTLVNLSKRVTW